MAEWRTKPMTFPLFPLKRSGGVAVQLVLMLESRTGIVPLRQPFRFDTGADVTMIPGHLESELNLDFPGIWETVEMTTAVGIVPKRLLRGRFRARIPGFGEEQFEWPCFFDEDNHDRFLLGMAGVVNGPGKRLKITLDGTPYGVSFPAGRFTIEVVRPEPLEST